MNDCQLPHSTQGISCCLLRQVASDSNSPAICSMSVRWCLFVCFEGFIEVHDSWYLMVDRYKKETLRRKSHLVMFVSTHSRNLTWNRGKLSCQNIRLASLLQLKRRSNTDFALFELIKRTNLDKMDSACLPVVHILQHPTSHRTTRSTHDTLVNAPKKNFSPLLAGKEGKSTKKSTRRRHHANDSKSGLEADRVRALGALHSLWCKKNCSAEKWQETYFLSNHEKETWIKDYMERETAVARKRV